jgi:pimeloyl-ACP methyl ester carboxylesterase
LCARFSPLVHCVIVMLYGRGLQPDHRWRIIAATFIVGLQRVSAMRLEVLSQEPSHPRPTPILFVHGAWHGAWCWDAHFLSYFAQHDYRVYALSLRGHGGSEAPRRFRLARISEYVADVAQVASQIDPAPVVIGHSMGGLVVQKYLESHVAPAGVLLASVPPRGVLRTTLSIAGRHPLRFLAANLTWSLYPLVGTPRLTREHFFSHDMPDQQLLSYFPHIQDESYVAFLGMLALNLPRPRRIHAPMLVLGAERDRIFTRREVVATARAYNSTATLFPSMAHDMMLEVGWQDVADAILSWLRQRDI